jgi:hypothetical protein
MELKKIERMDGLTTRGNFAIATWPHSMTKKQGTCIGTRTCSYQRLARREAAGARTTKVDLIAVALYTMQTEN